MSAWPWASSESTGKVIAAFVAALQGVEDVARTKTVNAGNMRYNYADLDAVLEAAKPTLTAQGLAVTQAASGEGVHAVVMHVTGEWLSFPPLQVSTQQNTPQGQGSALTYARRYQMLALLGIATEDDDGSAAAKPKKATRAVAPPAEPANADRPTERQTKMAMALFSEHGLGEKPERLAYTSDVLGRTVTSWSEVSKAEAGKVIDSLDKAGAA